MADDVAAKRRGPKFTAVESELLLVCIEHHRAVIECKRTDGVIAKAKDEAWQMVSGTFNALPNVSRRTAKQLRLWWDNQKKRTRLRFANNKVKLVETGGGPPSGKVTDWDERVAAIMSSTFEPLENSIDSDASYSQLSGNSCQQLVRGTSATGSVQQPVVTKVIESSSSSRRWAGRRRPFLQQKPTETAKSASVAASTTITECSAAKCELANLQVEIEKERKQHAADEHKLRMETMMEKHKWKLEEHQLKMELMRAELSTRRHAAEQQLD